MNFAREPYSEDLVTEMIPLWKRHYNEIAVYQDIALDPDLQLYRRGASQGTIRIFTAREDMELKGYQVFFVHAHPHYRSSIQAVQDILFMVPEMRKGFNGIRFIQYCDGELRKEEIQMVWQRVKQHSDHGAILERLGYIKHETAYTRRLDQ